MMKLYFKFQDYFKINSTNNFHSIDFYPDGKEIKFVGYLQELNEIFIRISLLTLYTFHCCNK